MTVPYAFGAATSAIPLSQLDSNFNTPITLGNTAIQLGNTVTTLNNMTLANVTISSGNVTITNVSVTTVNASTVNTTTLVATTANVTTINATDVNVAANVTLNAGTVNGVAYLNGSKVLTTGSALTFDGTNFGLGTNTPAAVGTTLAIHNSADSVLRLTNTTTGQSATNGFKLQANGTDAYLVNYSNGFMAFYTNATEQMRLTSTGLGIGTSSPTSIANYKSLTMNGTTGVVMDLQSNGTTLGRIQTDTTYALALWTATATPMVFGTNYTERMRLDSSGNLGLGVTPSAWTTFNVLQVGRTALAYTGNNTYVGTNWFFNGANRYIATDTASLYGQVSGQHQWFTAPSGTAGNAITFTQAMTLDASGNLGVGTTSPQLKLVVSNGGAQGFEVNPVSTSVSGGVDVLAYNRSTSAYAPINFDGSYQVFSTSNTERARITSGGDLLVGTASSFYGERFTVSQPNASKNTSVERNTSATPFGIALEYSTASPNGTGNYFINGTDSTALRFEVRSNGGLANYSANDVNLSDRREKTNFAPAKSYLDIICAIPVQTFNYIDQSEDDPGLTLGVVAQDVQAVAPELVMESNWGTEDNPKMRLSIYQTDLQYALMKALQELKAEFDAYKATHP